MTRCYPKKPTRAIPKTRRSNPLAVDPLGGAGVPLPCVRLPDQSYVPVRRFVRACRRTTRSLLPPFGSFSPFLLLSFSSLLPPFCRSPPSSRRNGVCRGDQARHRALKTPSDPAAWDEWAIPVDMSGAPATSARPIDANGSTQDATGDSPCLVGRRGMRREPRCLGGDDQRSESPRDGRRRSRRFRWRAQAFRTDSLSYATKGLQKRTSRPSTSGRAKRYACSWKRGTRRARRESVSSTSR